MNIEGLITKEKKRINENNAHRVNNNKRKLAYLTERCENENILLMILNESHLDKDILDEEINIPNFKVIRSDRIERKCGGVAIYIGSPLEAKNVKSFSNSVCELLICYIEKLNLHIISIYRPPKTTSDKLNPCLTEIQS